MIAAVQLACRKGHALSDVEQLIEECGWDVNARSTQRPRWTGLMLACASGRGDIALALVTRQADVHAEDDFCSTAVHVACQCGQLAPLKVLVHSKADVSAVNTAQQTPLMLAAQGGHGVCARLLIAAKSGVSSVDSLGKTALAYAISSCLEAELALEGESRSPLLEADNGWDTRSVQQVLLHTFATCRLLVDCRSNVNAVDTFGGSVLMAACSGGGSRSCTAGLVRLLLHAAANPRYTSPVGETALLCAEKSGAADKINILKAALGDDVKEEASASPSADDEYRQSIQTFLDAIEHRGRS